MLDVLSLNVDIVSNKNNILRCLITIKNETTLYETNFIYDFYNFLYVPDNVLILDSLIKDGSYGMLTFHEFINIYESLNINFSLDDLLIEHNRCCLIHNKLSNLFPNYLSIWCV